MNRPFLFVCNTVPLLAPFPPRVEPEFHSIPPNRPSQESRSCPPLPLSDVQVFHLCPIVPVWSNSMLLSPV